MNLRFMILVIHGIVSSFVNFNRTTKALKLDDVPTAEELIQ
jgi:hypothetical protein